MNRLNEKVDHPFNSPIEIGLRLLILLVESYPNSYSIQQLSVLDYLLIHSDDFPDGPLGVHPKTPQRTGEYLIRRAELHKSLLLFMSRNLIAESYLDEGVMYSATEHSAAFLDTLSADYTKQLIKNASWVISNFGSYDEKELTQLIVGCLEDCKGDVRSYSQILDGVIE